MMTSRDYEEIGESVGRGSILIAFSAGVYGIGKNLGALGKDHA